MEEIEQRHKTEQKELLGTIQAMKHGVPKGDKKRKKQVALDVAKMQADLDEKQAQEIKEFQSQNLTNGANELNLNVEPSTDSLPADEASNEENQPVQKMSKAAKRREKKEAEERARRKRLEEGEAESVHHSRNIEAQQFNDILQQKGLKMQEVDPDGNCLYNAVLLQLSSTKEENTLSWLRGKTSEHLLAHMEDLIAFTSNNTTGDMLTPGEYKKYCSEVKNTNSWGGQLELRAISQVLQRPIEVYQAASPVVHIGEEFGGINPIRLSYHRHQYGLGEHYNALFKDT